MLLAAISTNYCGHFENAPPHHEHPRPQLSEYAVVRLPPMYGTQGYCVIVVFLLDIFLEQDRIHLSAFRISATQSVCEPKGFIEEV